MTLDLAPVSVHAHHHPKLPRAAYWRGRDAMGPGLTPDGQGNVFMDVQFMRGRLLSVLYDRAAGIVK